jgi:hypothetical protein
MQKVINDQYSEVLVTGYCRNNFGWLIGPNRFLLMEREDDTAEGIPKEDPADTKARN